MTTLDAYLRLERLVLDLDADGEQDALAEDLRCVMDGLWYDLPAPDQDRLRSRSRAEIEARSTGPAPTAEEPAPDGGTRLVLLP